MKLDKLYATRQPLLSFELFPPKTPAGTEKLWHHVQRLMEFDPGYITCTYGAGGSTRKPRRRHSANQPPRRAGITSQRSTP